MRKLMKELFYIPKYGKVSEKTMLLRVAMIAITMVGCLAAMGFTAYAYFSHGISSGTNVIQAARFEAIVSIQYTNGDQVVTVEPDNNNAYVLQSDISYTVTLQLSANSTAKTGYVIVTDENGYTRYHSQQLGVDANAPGGRRESITFTATVTEETKLTFLSHWGTSSYYAEFKDKTEPTDYYITDQEAIALVFEKDPPVMMGTNPSVTEPTEPSQPTNPTEETEPVQPSYQLNYTDITANVGWATTLQLLDQTTNTPVTGLTWQVSEPDYISLEVLEDGVKVTGVAGTVGVEGVEYGRVWCEYEGVTYTCVFRIKDPNKTETTTP